MTEERIREIAEQYTADTAITPVVFSCEGELWLKLSKGRAEASAMVAVESDDIHVRSIVVCGMRFVDEAG